MFKSDCSGGGCTRHDAPDVAAGEALHSVNVEDATTGTRIRRWSRLTHMKRHGGLRQAGAGRRVTLRAGAEGKVKPVAAVEHGEQLMSGQLLQPG